MGKTMSQRKAGQAFLDKLEMATAMGMGTELKANSVNKTAMEVSRKLIVSSNERGTR